MAKRRTAADRRHKRRRKAKQPPAKPTKHREPGSMVKIAHRPLVY